MRPLHPGRNSMQFADIKVPITRICVRFKPKINVLELSTCLKTLVLRKTNTFFYAQAKVLLPNWPYWPWDHITFSERNLILLEKRYQKHEILGFHIFQILLELIHFSVNIWEPYGSIWKASGGTKVTGYLVPSHETLVISWSSCHFMKLLSSGETLVISWNSCHQVKHL